MTVLWMWAFLSFGEPSALRAFPSYFRPVPNLPGETGGPVAVVPGSRALFTDRGLSFPSSEVLPPAGLWGVADPLSKRAPRPRFEQPTGPIRRIGDETVEDLEAYHS